MSETGTPEIAEQSESGAGPQKFSRRRIVMSAFGGLIAIPSLGALFGRCMFSGPRWQGAVTEHFDGENFLNLGGVRQRGTGEVIKWRRERNIADWVPVEGATFGPKPPERVGVGELRATPVGHASVLVQMDEHNILTDPVWSERCSPVSWAGPKRMRPPGIRYEDLPPIDAVLISHNHYDHLDMATLKMLMRDHKPKVFCALGNQALLQENGISTATDLHWWRSAALGPLTIHAIPAQHWSGRGLCDRTGTHWCGYMIESQAGSVLFAGDTGLGPHFEMIRSKLGPPRLALLPIGAHLPRWFMQSVHMSAADAVLAHQTLGADVSMAIHHGVFQLADEERDQPLEELRNVLIAAGISSAKFQAPQPGERVIVG